MMSFMTSWAVDWTRPSIYDYPGSTPLYVLPVLHGEVMDDRILVGAFIDGECRAMVEAYSMDYGNEMNPYLALRVLGSEADNGKTIEIRILHNNLEYLPSVSEVVKYDGETETHTIGIELPVDLLTEVTIDESISLVEKMGTKVDLSSYVHYSWGETGTPTGCSEMITPITANWSPIIGALDPVENEPSSLIVVGNTESEEPMAVDVRGEEIIIDGIPTHYENNLMSLITVEVQLVGVESITVTPNTFNAAIGDNIYTYLRRCEVTVLPEDASNKQWHFEYDGMRVLPGSIPRFPISEEGDIKEGGSHKVYVVSDANPSIKATVTFNVTAPTSFAIDDEFTLTKGNERLITYKNATGEIDPELVTVSLGDPRANGDYGAFAIPTATGIKFVGKYIGSYTMRVYYDERSMKNTAGGETFTVRVNDELVMPTNGWDWVSLPARPRSENGFSLESDAAFLYDLNRDDDNKIIEIRSQDELLYNDPSIGLFGTIRVLEPKMYQIKARYAEPYSFIYNYDADTNIRMATLKTGYNWLNNPNEFDLTLDELNNMDWSSASDGDLLIGKTSFAEYDAVKEQWVSSNDFTFKSGKGYIYYCKDGDRSSGLNFRYRGIPQYYQTYSPAKLRRSAAKTLGVFVANTSDFANNMPVVAVVKGVADLEQCMIGAFVGDECRGMGKMVGDGKFFINVAGNNGEKVTYRLYNEATGQFTDMLTTTTYTTNHVGSLKAPVTIAAGDITAVRNIESVSINSVEYNLAGQRVNGSAKGIIVKGGKKYVK